VIKHTILIGKQSSKILAAFSDFCSNNSAKLDHCDGPPQPQMSYRLKQIFSLRNEETNTTEFLFVCKPNAGQNKIFGIISVKYKKTNHLVLLGFRHVLAVLVELQRPMIQSAEVWCLTVLSVEYAIV
jgi:hypothetical protein